MVDKILTNEAPGILAWAVKGCLLWQQEGLEEPTAIKTATADYRSEMDSFSSFFEECCVRGSGSVQNKQLRSAYNEWCMDNGEYAMSQRHFNQKLVEMGFKRKRAGGSGLTIWQGFCLKWQEISIVK